MYILVLEDDPLLCFDVCDALAEFDIAVKGALNVSEAIECISNARPALALLDYNIKSETSAAVAELLALEDVPFGYVTADADSVRQDPRIPDCPIVDKPYRADEIVELVAQLLRR
jgi:DNA-binding response OmpR family regulator